MATKKVVKYGKFNQDEVKDQHQILTDKIIAKMEEAVQYEKPWFENTTEAPYNPVTGTKYRGINFISLLVAGFTDPRFYTYNNLKKLSEDVGENIHVRKGEKGIPVFKAMQKTFTNTDKDTGEEKSFTLWRQVYAGTVFNASQIEGIAPLVIRQAPEGEVNEELNKIVTAMSELSGLKVSHHAKGQAYYKVSTDEIYVPYLDNFKSVDLYQRTLAHELGHATGHEKRLNRDLTGSFGNEKYAYEELIAELSSYFMGASLGFKYDSKTHENHAAYLNSWLNALKKDKNMIFKAASAASKVVDYQLNIKKEFFNEFTPEELKTKEIKLETVEESHDEEPVIKKLKIG